MKPDRRALIAGAGAWLAAGPLRAQDGLALSGRWVQGGFAFGRTWPGATVRLGDEVVARASDRGLFVVGFDRDAPATARIEVRAGERSAIRDLSIAAGEFPSSRIDGLPPSTVEPTDPDLLARIRREAALKAEGFASREEGDAFRDGFVSPLPDWRVSSQWGAQRILNGTPARPHYGIDLAAPAGTVISAPADGRVCLAQPGLHFEGGLTLLDHGQGLISAYLHQSELLVREGDRVRRGDPLGKVGQSGRATGPHLCWRLKWRDRNLDPSLLIGAKAPNAVSP